MKSRRLGRKRRSRKGWKRRRGNRSMNEESE